jgi:hypothetical protein
LVIGAQVRLGLDDAARDALPIEHTHECAADELAGDFVRLVGEERFAEA